MARMGARGPERPRRSHRDPASPPRATYWPHPGPATSQESQVPTPKAPFGKKSSGGPRPAGAEMPSARGGTAFGMGEGRAIPPENEGRVSVLKAPSGLPCPLPQEAAPPALAAVRGPGRSALTLTSPRGPPGQPRRRPRRPSAGGGVAQPCLQALGGRRRRSGPGAPRRSAGRAPLPPRAPYAQPARPPAQAPRPHSPPRSAPAPHASGARREGGEVTR